MIKQFEKFDKYCTELELNVYLTIFISFSSLKILKDRFQTYFQDSVWNRNLCLTWFSQQELDCEIKLTGKF